MGRLFVYLLILGVFVWWERNRRLFDAAPKTLDLARIPNDLIQSVLDASDGKA